MSILESPLWEVVGRASVVYLALAVVLRWMPKRNAGGLSPNDLIALVLIGGLTADAISSGETSTVELLIMVAVVFFWDYMLNLLEYHFPRFRKVAQDTPTLLIHNGRVIRKNLRRELMTEEELSAVLRKKGITDISTLRQAVLEVDGEVSTIKADEE